MMYLSALADPDPGPLRQTSHSFFKLRAAQVMVISLLPPQEWPVHEPASVLSEAEQRRLLVYLCDQARHAPTASKRWQALRNRALVGCAIFAGLRVEEIVALRWPQLTLNVGAAGVQQVVGPRGRVRDVPLPEVARRWLMAYAQASLDAYLLLENEVFLGQRGPMRAQSVYHLMEDLGRLLDLPPLSGNALRRAYAAGLLAGGAPLGDVSHVLGLPPADEAAAPEPEAPPSPELLQAIARLDDIWSDLA